MADAFLSLRPITFLAALLTLHTGAVVAGPLHDDVIRNVVHIEATGGRATGITILYNDKVYVLTAAHVVSGCMLPRQETFLDATGSPQVREDKSPLPVECFWKDGSARKARVLWYSAAWESGGVDLALLEPEGHEEMKKLGYGAELLKRGEEPEVGEDAWYCGSGAGARWGLEKSIVSRLEDRHLVVNGCGWYGHSGSGVFVKRGDRFKLVGIMTQFMVVPDKHTKSPMECERKLWDFLDSFKK